jgi:hypothetical protein
MISLYSKSGVADLMVAEFLAKRFWNFTCRRNTTLDKDKKMPIEDKLEINWREYNDRK